MSAVKPEVVAMLADIELLDEFIERAARENRLLLGVQLQDLREAVKKEYTAWTGLEYIEEEAHP